MLFFRRKTSLQFKVLSALSVLFFFFVYHQFWDSIPGFEAGVLKGSGGVRLQHAEFAKSKDGLADEEKAQKVTDAMRWTFEKYRERAWGDDDVRPVSGGSRTSRNGWGAFIVDTSTTLPLMGLWEEFRLELDHITKKIDFTNASGLVDPFETTIRYLGALASLVDLIDVGLEPMAAVTKDDREGVFKQAISLATKLGPGFDSPTGMIWPRVDFLNDKPSPDPPEVLASDPVKAAWKHPAIGPARAGSNILEYKTLTRLTGNPIYTKNATNAWAPLVWNKNPEPMPGLVEAPIDIFTGEPVGKMRTWEAGHDSYYEYLIKAVVLHPHGQYSKKYRTRWIQAAESLRKYLATQSNVSSPDTGQRYTYIGRYNEGMYWNEMSHLACFAPGNLMYGGKYLGRKDLVDFGVELLEACHHSYISTPTRVGPEQFSWFPDTEKYKLNEIRILPTDPFHNLQLEKLGYWTRTAQYRLRPEYVESLFYAWRLTGEQRYRDWAWDAFTAIEPQCKDKYGYAGLRNVFQGTKNLTKADYTESFWGAETLKYLYLTFSDVNVGSLDRWVYSTEGHLFRIH